jgi:hypothetical protein
VKEYLATENNGWKAFYEGEVKKSNDLNNKSLGGQQPRGSGGDSDENENHYEVNMEKIMARFTNFNSLITSSNSN